MKKITILILAASALYLTSCSNDILSTSPTNQVSTENMWTTPTLAEKGINGLYEALINHNQSKGTQVRWENLDGLNKYGIEGMGFCTSYYANNYPLTLLSGAAGAKDAGDCQINHEWMMCFGLIHSCNDALANLHKAGLDETTLENYTCQARFLRAWAYYRLNQMFWGVPLYLEPISQDQCTKTQSTASEIWQQVIDDLTYCIENPAMPKNTLTEQKGRPSKGAAYALRGMSYMWMTKLLDANAPELSGTYTEKTATELYEAAIDDFDKVLDCGYSLFTGKYSDLFTVENEACPEMIWTIQYSAETGYSDNIQQALGARDTYGSWDEVMPSADFVNYYQNADGTTFDWASVPGLEDWNKLTAKQRAVFFCRDGLKNEGMESFKDNAIAVCSHDAFDKYYLNSGNEARIKKAYDSRDPRLKMTILTPYEPVDCYTSVNNIEDRNAIGKQLRWPLVEQGFDGGDFWMDQRTSGYYCYRKYVHYTKGLLEANDRQRCYTDFPLIRVTDVTLRKAECLVELDRLGEAKTIVNRIRSRAYMPATLASSKDEMREAVRYERRVEFPVEAVNFFDELRWGTYKQTKFQGLDVHGFPSWWGDDTVIYRWYWDDNFWPLPAPRKECQKNLDMIRRPGWQY